ncbi:MAG: hypothetical protein RMJ55_04440, partial [Roseiflexaceae bacterium]|nr:hypothetical protein [Roseiflexaceae bacterium]
PAVYITGIGFPALSVTDSLGNLVGSDGTLAVTDTVAADYYPLGADAHALVFPAGDTYTVTLRTGDGPFNLELTRGTGDSADLAVRYVDLSLPAHISATLRITPQGVEPLRADIDGDGTFETVIPPTVDVTGAAANDLDAPVVTISATGPLAAKTVTITATDGGAGVKQLLYSLDGTTFQPYTAPFVVDATQTPVVYAFADDNVANRSSLVTWRLAWPIYLPLTAR